MYPKYIACEILDWVELALETAHWEAFGNRVMNF
jgi:hypothetical protein